MKFYLHWDGISCYFKSGTQISLRLSHLPKNVLWLWQATITLCFANIAQASNTRYCPKSDYDAFLFQDCPDSQFAIMRRDDFVLNFCDNPGGQVDTSTSVKTYQLIMGQLHNMSSICGKSITTTLNKQWPIDSGFLNAKVADGNGGYYISDVSCKIAIFSHDPQSASNATVRSIFQKKFAFLNQLDTFTDECKDPLLISVLLWSVVGILSISLTCCVIRAIRDRIDASQQTTLSPTSPSQALLKR